MKTAIAAVAALTLSVALTSGAQACVSASGAYINNNCTYPVIVRYDRGYGRMQSGLISAGGSYWTDSPRRGYVVSVIEWCNTGGRQSWTCN